MHGAKVKIAIVLTPSGSSTVDIYTQKFTQNNTMKQNIQNETYVAIIYIIITIIIIYLLWRCDPTRVMASSFLRFSTSHTTTQHSR